jgi:hypothetical protein
VTDFVEQRGLYEGINGALIYLILLWMILWIIIAKVNFMHQ